MDETRREVGPIRRRLGLGKAACNEERRDDGEYGLVAEHDDRIKGLRIGRQDRLESQRLGQIVRRVTACHDARRHS